jgi:hypothetical protein
MMSAIKEREYQELPDSFDDELPELRITVGGSKFQGEKGDVHLEEGESFEGLFKGFAKPDAYDNPVMIFEVNGAEHQMNSFTAIQKKLLKLCPNNQATGNEKPVDPVPVRLTFKGEERTKQKRNVYIFKVEKGS